MSLELEAKETALRQTLKALPNALVAYSGGVDSAYLLWVAAQTLGSNVLGVIADSPSLKRTELEQSLAFAQHWNLPLRVIQTDELANPDYTSNPLNRCFHCKGELFTKMTQVAQLENYSALCYGENADDALEFRPGQQAALNFQVRSPLREVGLTKADIRTLASLAQLSVADKVSQPCLASRIPHGQIVTPEKLSQVEQAESILQNEGFKVFRVRHQNEKALVLVAPEETSRLFQPEILSLLTEKIQACGFSNVEFDPLGYRKT